jgi:hypothetical protein
MDEVRHQVFVSSTFLDLKEERQAAVEAILQARHIPAGMELFAAEDRRQLDVIKSWIDESDIYLLIVGSRYGSIEPDSGYSYTEYEYRYALDNGKPVFALVLSDKAIDAKHRALGASASDAPDKLTIFRKFVMERMVRSVDTTDQIKLATLESILTLQRNKTIPGWVRSTSASKEIALELARVSAQNSVLAAENSKLRAEIERKKTGSAQNTDPQKWATTLDSIQVKSPDGTKTLSLLEVFLLHTEHFAAGVSNGFGANQFQMWLFEIAKQLAALGLAERGKAPASVHWIRLQLSKEGVTLSRELRHMLAAAEAANPDTVAERQPTAVPPATQPQVPHRKPKKSE